MFVFNNHVDCCDYDFLYFEILICSDACMCCLHCDISLVVMKERWSMDKCVMSLDILKKGASTSCCWERCEARL